MQDIYETFEFIKIKEKILEYSKTDLGKEYILNLKMFNSKDELSNALLDLEEMSFLYLRFGPLPIFSSANALALIDLAKKSGLLTPRDLHLIANDVLTLESINKYLKKIDLNYPRIKETASSFYDLTSLEKEIHRCINSALVVDDKASPTLKEIRNKIKKLENELNQKGASIALSYSAYLNDDNPTIRDGHYVLPVKTAYKNKVVGIIYDVSDSGNTTFIEPLEIVNINNSITSLRVEENEEVRKILKMLTNLVLLQENEIIANNKIIAKFDFLLAKSIYGQEINGVIAKISDKPNINLIKARHPLIDVNKVVANSYSLNDIERIIVISGPNAGGKTISLKTVGMIVLMHQAGLFVPCDKAEISFINNIYIDIGDNQSLSDNLSTFSAHISQISEIVNRCKANDLLLLDELGTGTDPKEGEALALAVTKYIESKHSLALISSHFSALKEYGFVSKNVINSSMIFDEEHLKPTYIFMEGTPGKSYALDVASRFNLPPSIIKESKAYLSTLDTSSTSELLDILQKKVEEVTKLELANTKLKKELENKERLLNEKEERLNERKDNLLEEVKLEKERLLTKTKEEIDEILSALNSGDKKLHEVIELKRKIEELEDTQEIYDFNEHLHVNDYVSIPSLGLNGKITRINGKKGHIVSDSGLSFDVELNKLHKIDEIKPTNKKINSEHHEMVFNSVPLELNIIGLRVDEAMDKLSKYIDSCRVKHHKTVRIIHGFGSGALRKATRSYLDKQKDLTYRNGDAYEGGSGATIVIFND